MIRQLTFAARFSTLHLSVNGSAIFARQMAARPKVQFRPTSDSTSRQMDQPSPHESPPLSRAMRGAAFSVHIFTAMGAGVALIALLEAVREHWAAMFGWLGVALIIDALDGPIARRLDVVRVQPDWRSEERRVGKECR